jgi:hypothetical protein
MVTLYVAAGYVNGYVSGSLYRTFKGTNWVLNAFVSATLYPGVIFVVFCVLNTLIWHAKELGRGAVWDVFLINLPVVRRLRALGVRGRVPRAQNGENRTPHAHE